MFTLYRIGFCSVSKVAPVHCEQELMFCHGVLKRSQCEQSSYPSYNIQRSLLIWKDHLPKRGSVAISAPIKVFRLDSDRCKTYPIRNVPLSAEELSSTVLEQKLLRKKRSWCEQKPCPVHFLWRSVTPALFHCPVQCEHSLRADAKSHKGPIRTLRERTTFEIWP